MVRLSKFVRGSIVIASLLSLLHVGSSAQGANDITPKTLALSYFAPGENLISSATNCLYQDRVGILWVGTNNGLIRYDGHEIKTYQYNVFDSTSIPNNSINSICEDDFGNLWIGTESYLVRFNTSSEVFTGFFKNLTSRCFFSSSDKTIWGSQRREGLIQITPGEALGEEVFRTSFESQINQLGQNSLIQSIEQDERGRIWIGTNKGLNIYKEAEMSSTHFEKNVTIVRKDNDQTLWVAHDDSLSLIQYSLDTKHIIPLKSIGLSTAETGQVSRINCLIINNEGALWVGTDLGLFKIINPQTTPKIYKIYNQLNTPIEIQNKNIRSLLLDDHNNLWVGTNQGLLKHVDGQSIFENISFDKLKIPAYNNVVSVMYYDNSGNLWFVDQSNALFRYNLATGETTENRFPVTRIRKINQAYNQEGLLLICQNTVYHLDKEGSLTHLYTSDKEIFDVVQLSPDEYWIALWEKGIDILDKTRALPEWKKKAINHFQDFHSFTMHLDREENLWIGTRGEGLYRVSMREEKIYDYLPSKENHINTDAFLSIIEDKYGNIWLATRGGGIINYAHDTKLFQSLTMDDGLTNNIITGIEADNEGNIWFTTPNEVGVFDQHKSHFRTFGPEDGITISNYGFRQTAFNSKENQIYIGNSSGIQIINSSQYYKEPFTDQTIITGIKSFGKEASTTNKSFLYHRNKSKNTTLPHTQNNFTVTFSNLDFTAPQKNNYSFMLEGINDYWIRPNKGINSASFYDVAPGKYTFYVKSTNSLGEWGTISDPLVISISPPFWQSTTAYIIYFLLSLGLLYILYYFYVRWYNLNENLLRETISHQKDRQHHKMRMEYFTDIAHELRTPLSLIMSSSEYALKNGYPPKEKSIISKIFDNALKMKQLIDQIMDIRKHNEGEFKLQVERTSIKDFIHQLVLNFSDIAVMHEQNLSFSCEEVQIVGYIDHYICEKIISNLISNALKYTEKGGQVRVQVATKLPGEMLPEVQGDILEISVYDDGIGLDKEDKKHLFDRYYQSENLHSSKRTGSGIGMELVSKLTSLHHGKIQVESEKGIYTLFSLYLPIHSQNYKGHELKKISQLFPPVEQESKISPSLPPRTHKYNAPSILLVEDNDDLRQSIKNFLSKEYNVMEAINGENGYNLAVEKHPDLILSDIYMPDSDGILLLRKIKSNPETEHIPVYMLTAKDSREIKEKCLQLKASDFIEKPFSIDFLLWKIKNTLDQQDKLKKKYSKTISAQTSQVDIESPDELLVKELADLIEKNISSDHLSVEYLAGEIGMSRATLYRKVKQITGETPVNFIKQLRLQRAKQIIKMNKFYMYEVANMCGFNSQKYFRQCFLKEFGLTPAEYKQKSQNPPVEAISD